MTTDLSLIRILTVDDHPLLRKGIAALVNAETDMKLVAEASNGEEAIEKFRSYRPDVTLMDLQMPGLNGIEAMSRIQSEFPNARIIVLTTYTGDAQVVRALKAGARAYLLKRQVHRELLETIRTVHAGQRRIPQEMAAELVDHARDDLTPRAWMPCAGAWLVPLPFAFTLFRAGATQRALCGRRASADG